MPEGMEPTAPIVTHRPGSQWGWQPAALNRGECLRLSVGCALSSTGFAWACLVLPVAGGDLLQWLTGIVSAVHGLTATGAALQSVWPRIRGLRPLGHVMAVTSCVAALYFLYSLAATGRYLVKNYGQLGWGLSGGLALIGVLLLGLTLPTAHYWYRHSAGHCRS